MSKVIMIDLDGVLVDFLAGYRAIERMRGIPVTTSDKWEDYNKTEVWTEIKASDTFWMLLAPTQELLNNPKLFVELNDINSSVYYVTSRVGKDVRRQSEYWLNSYGIRRPMVIISNRKESVAHGIGATHSIEDREKNAFYIATMSGAKSYLINRPHNQESILVPRGRLPMVTRIDTVEEFIKEVHLNA